MDIIVIANHRRPPVITEFLEGIPHRICWSDDPPMPSSIVIKPEYRGLCSNHVAAYRCLVAHQKALGMMSGEFALVFEDDAHPVQDYNWKRLVALAGDWRERFAVISFHGRGYNPWGWQKQDCPFGWGSFHFWIPPDGQPLTKICGASMVYLINREAAKRYQEIVYDGLPADWLLTTVGKFALVEPSPFWHDRKHGSLIEVRPEDNP